MATNSAAKREITRISTERQLLQMFSSVDLEDLAEVLQTAEIKEIRAGQTIINEGEEGFDIFVIRQGSMVVEKNIGGKPVFLSYLAGRPYVGEMALIDRPAHRDGPRRDQVRGDQARRRGFRRLAQASPSCSFQLRDMVAPGAHRLIEARKDGFGGVVDMYSSVAGFGRTASAKRPTCCSSTRSSASAATIASAPAPTPMRACRASTARPAGPTPTSTCRPAAAIASIRTAWPIARPTRSTAARTARSSSTTPASAAAIASAIAPMA